MLFNSYPFIFVFLPLTLFLYFYLGNRGLFRPAIFSLVIASLIYYGWWNPKYLILIFALLMSDYASVKGMERFKETHPRWSQGFLAAGLTANLGALCYYKYANFIVDNVNLLAGAEFHLASIVLPVGISFFTFQKMAFLVDYHEGKIRDVSLMNYMLFVMFFPQLIAGPIIHHSEVMPQFAKPKSFSWDSMGLGITFFVIGLCKKMILADTAARFASPQFQAAAGGTHLDFLAAWSGTLAYTAQLYFDFSAYSDMAIGLGQMFGIDLPINFNSPYKSKNIVDFWRRWHMTLSRFLRDYLYIPLGGNRKGPVRRYVNLFLTMFLGGIWHGAGWTFLVWGALHGSYLIINHGWQAAKSKLSLGAGVMQPAAEFLSGALTFLAVIVGWVFFRASDLSSAADILKSMAGLHGFAMPASLASRFNGLPVSSAPIDSGLALLVAIPLLVVCWLAPNSQQLLGYLGVAAGHTKVEAETSPVRRGWQPNWQWAVFAGCLLAFSLTLFSQVSEFIYYQF